MRILFLGMCMVALLFVTGCTQPALPAAGPVSTVSPVAAPSAQVTSATPPVSVSAAPSKVVTTATTPVILKRGTADPDFIVDISVPDKISPGTTILPDNHDASHPRIIEVNQLGEIVWEYPLPAELKAYTNPGWDVEVLPNGNLLTLFPRYGVYEISRDKKVIWKYLDSKVSHDADRLANGNTLIAFGATDTKTDAQVKEVDPKGNIVWSWHAKDLFDHAPYSSINSEGWTHTNAVTRLENGNTLVSLRNFNLVAEVDPSGKLVRKIGEGVLIEQHDPLLLPNGNLLIANHGMPHEMIELDPMGAIVWRFPIRERSGTPARDVNRLPNGNNLITAADRILEVTPDKQIVWQFRMAKSPFSDQLSYAALGFYKAERIPE